MKRPFDLSLAIAGILATILIIGTVVLAIQGREVPSVITTADLAVLGFFFSKGVGAAVSEVTTRNPPPPPTPPPIEGERKP